MFRALLVLILAAGICSPLTAQRHSIQFSGGIVSPITSSKGLTGIVTYNYPLNEKVNLYAYSGYVYWYRYNVHFRTDYSSIQKETMFTAYDADDFKLIPLYAGAKMLMHSNDFMDLHLGLETGYSYLSYYTYSIIESKNPETGQILGYYPDQLTKKKINDNLFCLGLGAELTHPMSNGISLFIALKLNTFINSRYPGFLSTRGTYTSLSGGVDILI